ncbi:Mediator of RNA polymerase II transcription subunit 7 [[Candida] zeylanoides]
MTDDLISSLYPPPPPYYRFFTEENVEAVQQWKESQGDESTEADAPATEVPPGELRFLVPPQPPAGPHYRNFGNLWSFEDKLPTLTEMGLRQLYPEDDATISSQTKIGELHKLLDSLLLGFLELIAAVSIEPAKFHLKVEDLKTLLININHILNSYRPHQSRESLIMLLRKQIEQKRAEIRDVASTSAEVRLKIKQCLNEVKVKVMPSQAPTEPSQDKREAAIQSLLERETPQYSH